MTGAANTTTASGREVTALFSANWAPALRMRRKVLLQRLGMGAAAAMVCKPLFGLEAAVVWMVCYGVVQMLDIVLFAPVTRGQAETLSPWRTVAGAILLFVNAATFGSLSVLLWLNGGALGGVSAAILLASGAIYAVVNSPRSPQVLSLSIAPHLIYMAMMPLFMIMNGAKPEFVTAAAISVAIFATFCFSTWININNDHQSESRARVEAEKARAEAERAMESRSAFLAAIGHDLRTPIGAILTGADEMDRIAPDAMSRSNAALITDAGLLMKSLLDDLLDHSKLDAGRMTVEVTDFNLRSMMAQTLKLWQGPVRAKGLSLRVEGASSLPAMVRGDAMRVRQVLNNLLSNALKFTDEGAITLKLDCWAEEPSGHALLLEVSDTGPGMTQAQLARLFTPFDQTAEGVSARHGGTGLGLSISRDLAELMGGRLTARSAPGEGARFTLSIVLASALDETVVVPAFNAESRVDIARTLDAGKRTPPVDRPVAAPVSTSGATVVVAVADAVADDASNDEDDEGRPLRVLVVDDHDINRRAVELILAPLGCDIVTAADGLLALAQCEGNTFDVIFMDVRMPELDGRETTRRLRAGGGVNAHVPVIAVTADTGPEDIAACMDAGMTYFVSKPLTPAALLGALQHVLTAGEDQAIETIAA